VLKTIGTMDHAIMNMLIVYWF